ncbi:MAG TPA: DUF2520 domain-containing protein, partial [Pilimelia sp.]|nr:DUF2520 domain-containing protein [Pilimelia sp.]
MTRIGVVGAGRVGAVLAAALRSAGHDVAAVSGESRASRARIEALLPGVAVATPTAVARACDLLLLTVPDDMLGNVATTLSAAGAIRPGQQVVHASGKHGLAVLRPAADRGAHVLALHPAMTFTGTDVDLARLSGCRLGITATPATESLAAQLVADLGGTAVRVDEDRRALYHAGIAHGANHLVTLVAQAADLLRASGVDDPAGVLRPLLAAVLDNALASGDAALTGPVARGDVETVRAHLADVAATAPATLESYATLARATTSRAVLDGRLPQARATELLGV